MSVVASVLDARVRAVAGSFGLEAAVQARAGELVVVVGPNGAGKTTLLRTLAGLHPMAAGHVRVDGRDVTALVGRDRRVGYVPQSAALFPHLSVLGNVAFGVGASRRRRRAVAAAWLDRVGAQEWAHRRASGLSGGQVARVALARALAAEPVVLLLDEPLAAVDAAARPGLRRLLREHASGFAGATVLVTHDPVDALVLADRLVVLEEGRVVQDAPPQQLVRAPRSVWAARLLGLNAYRGRLDGDAVRVDGGGVLHVAAGAAQAGPGEPAGAALAVVAPSAVALHRQRPSGSPRNVWPGVVAELAGLGGRVRVGVEAAPPVVAEVTPAAAAELALREGDQVWVSVKATEVSVTRV